MKLIALLMFITGLTGSYASVYSQQIKLNLKVRNTTVKDILKQIEEQSDYSFMYNNNQIDVYRKVDLDVENSSVEDILQKVFAGIDISYKILDRHIIISSGSDVAPPVQSQQPKTITGKVTDQSGTPLPGVTVVIKGTTQGTITSSDGNYNLSNIPPGAKLQFSFVGMRPVEISADGKTTLKVTMYEEAIGLEEVVAVGYGVQRKSDITGAVVSVNTDEMKSYPATNITEMLRGRAAGIRVQNTSGRPGSTSSISIRGVRSLSASNSPLYVVDGTPVTSTEFSTISSDDVISVEILKDAASQAVYGARAANGVVLVSTKRGDSGKAEITVSGSVSSQHLWKNFDFYSPLEFYELRKQSIANDNKVDPETLTPEEVFYDDEALAAYNEGKTTDWEGLMFDPAIRQTYSLGIRGGTEKAKISASFGYLDHKGMVVTGSGYKRGNVRLNVDYMAYKWLSIGINTSLAKMKTATEEGNFTGYITSSPYGTPYDDEGNLKKYINSNGDINPLYRANYYKNEAISDILRFDGYLDIFPFKGFSYRLSWAYYNRFAESGEYKQAEYPGGGSAGSIDNSKSYNYLVENIINYKAPFSSKNHSLNITAMQGWDKTISRSLGFGSNNVPVDAFWWNMIADGEVTSKTRTYSEHIILSYMARVQYSFKDRYLLNAVVRHDGSSRLAKNNRWATFPSVALGWRINEEPFLKEVVPVSNLKLRVSYGEVGNQDGIGNYTTLGTTSDYAMEFGDNFIMGYLPSSTFPNTSLKWERTASTNFGIDFGFFSNRLQGTIEYYLTRTTNLLVERSINSVLGYSAMLDNLGETKTTGFDLSISGDIISNKSFVWNVGVNLSTFKNKIVKVDDNVDENGNPADDVSNNWFIGHPISVYYNYKTDGIYQYSDFDLVDGNYVLKPTFDSDGDGIPDKAIERSDVVAPGKIKVVDKNNDGKIDADDRFIIPRDSKFVASLFTSFEYKGFSLLMDWYAVRGRKIQNAYLYNANNGGSLNGKLNGIKVNYWTPDNPSNEWPRPSHNSGITYHSSLAIQDASYIRLRSLTLGYTFPTVLTNKVLINNARIYFTATNLFTITEFSGYSPEFTPAGYPEPRQFTVGLNLTL